MTRLKAGGTLIAVWLTLGAASLGWADEVVGVHGAHPEGRRWTPPASVR